MRKAFLMGIGLVFWLFSASVLAQEVKTFRYIGSDGCKKCHLTKKSGAAYRIWQRSKHAQAYQVLASEKAMAIARERGIDDPQKAAACLQCHVTAHGVDAKLLGPKYSIEEGVGCETCHGPGSAYSDKQVKEDIVAGKIDPKSVGLLMPTEEDCLECHNEKSPTYKPFNFEERMQEIAHPTPKK